MLPKGRDLLEVEIPMDQIFMETPYMKLTSLPGTQDYCREHAYENLPSWLSATFFIN